jgi:hypothetical protein
VFNYFCHAASFLSLKALISLPVKTWSLTMHLFELCEKLIHTVYWFETKCEFRTGFQLVNFPCYALWRACSLGIITSLRDLHEVHSFSGGGGARSKESIYDNFSAPQRSQSVLFDFYVLSESIKG